jgi:hypothetical protein
MSTPRSTTNARTLKDCNCYNIKIYNKQRVSNMTGLDMRVGLYTSHSFKVPDYPDKN